MYHKILITGPPRSGKSTLIKKLIEYYKKRDIEIGGFLTPEIRENESRVGFSVKRISNNEKIILAKKGNHPSAKKLGSYSVFIEKFEKFIEFLNSNANSGKKILFIDEIGKMELYSNKFLTYTKRLFKSQMSIIATIGLNLKHPLKDWLLSREDIELFKLDRNNQNEIFRKIISKESLS